ncbi:Maf family protein [Fodinisporobacter ferrooxydans]|uniref:dTTP/UTP pyrophosphatase n=1 Tax=Fodinisporobacter ferrooxydans TaxID=2901836 RepID=A0ABY4CIC0_9BACL|nr:Maf family protein [Alicyclobacillaceae bacterium MYW30-H2]
MTIDSKNGSRRIILASGSPRRRELLEQLGLSFDVITSDVAEQFDPEMPPAEVVQFLADKKGAAVANSIKHGLVIAADTIVVIDEQILGKPDSVSSAKQMLRRLAGRTHTVYSGIAVIDAETMNKKISYRSTVVHMRELSDEEIDVYVESGEPMDKAGAYAIQGIGSTLVTSVEGCYFTVVGLPMSLLAELLWEFGVNVLAVHKPV